MKRSGNTFFTLIELLISIAIIAILAGLLLPALNAARRKAQTMQCMNFQRQLGITLLQYTDDNNSCFPPNSIDSDWPGMMGRWYMGDYLVRYLGSPGKLKTLTLCPSTDFNSEPGGTGTRPDSSYGMAINTSTSSFRITGWHNPLSNALMMMDYGREGRWYYNGGGGPLQKNFLQYSYFFNDDPTKQKSTAVFTRHTQKANLLFADGHMESITKQTFQYHLSTYTRFSKRK